MNLILGKTAKTPLFAIRNGQNDGRGRPKVATWCRNLGGFAKSIGFDPFLAQCQTDQARRRVGGWLVFKKWLILFLNVESDSPPPGSISNGVVGEFRRRKMRNFGLNIDTQ